MGKKKVDLGGMFSPAAATFLTCATGVGLIRKAASQGPDRTSLSASSVSRAYQRPLKGEMSPLSRG